MDEKVFDRRRIMGVLAGLGGVAALGRGTALLSGSLPTGSPAPHPSSEAKVPWPYRHLDPDAVGQRAFTAFAKGHCMYACFEGVVGSVADLLGEPYTSFPFEMMVYGAAGVAGWGTLCGTLNGSAAAIQLLSRNPGPVTDELYLWYEQTALPNWDPKGMRFKTVSSLAGSPLCHASIAHWCATAGKKAYSPERDERCGVLAASVARKTAMLLNAQATGTFVPALAIDPRSRTCRGCHEQGGEMEDIRAKQDCAACHTDASLEQAGHQKITL